MCGQVRPFRLDDDGQKLILQPRRGNHKVHNGCLRLYLWRVVGVGELGVEEQPKFGVLLDFIVSEQDDASRASPDECPRDNWENNRVNRLAHVFNDDREASFHGLLKPAKNVFLPEAQDLKVVGFLFQLEPGDSL